MILKKHNNYAFIDSQNLNLSIRDCGWQLDFKRFFIAQVQFVISTKGRNL